MDIQELLNLKTKEWLLERSQEMVTLGELIAKLEGVDSCYNVFIELPDGDIVTPTELISYRGYYSDLAIDYEYDNVVNLSVAEFKTWLKDALGKTFIGYKGGDFTMTKITPMWVDQVGRCQNIAVAGVYAEDFGRCIIKTMERHD